MKTCEVVEVGKHRSLSADTRRTWRFPSLWRVSSIRQPRGTWTASSISISTASSLLYQKQQRLRSTSACM